MEKYNNVKMQDLLKVEDTGSELMLIFRNGTRIKITVKDNKLQADVLEA